MHLPTAHLPTPPAQATRRIDYSVHARANGWAVQRAIWFIDVRGEQDVYADDVSLWPTEAEAHGEIVAIHAMLSPALRVAA